LKETPLPNPLQRTEWNVWDSDAALIITDSQGLEHFPPDMGHHPYPAC